MSIDPETLQPNEYVDCDHPAIQAFAQKHRGKTKKESAINLFYEVRELLRYNPWGVRFEPETFRASTIFLRDREKGGHCIDKALILSAACRALGIPSRQHFATVRNHIGTASLEEKLGTDLLVYHGYSELYLDDKWVAATPAFNRELCERLGVVPLEFDGESDAIFQEYAGGGKRFLEYVEDHGSHNGIPWDAMIAAWEKHYPSVRDRVWPNASPKE